MHNKISADILLLDPRVFLSTDKNHEDDRRGASCIRAVMCPFGHSFAALQQGFLLQF